MNNQIRIYPIRKTRKKWNINLYKYHSCSEACNTLVLSGNSQLILTTNPHFKNGICEKHNKLERTFIRLVDFNEDGTTREGDKLYGIDDIVVPDSGFSILISYPVSYALEVSINSNKEDGYTLLEIINTIKTVYEYIYAEEENTATPQVYNLQKLCYNCGNRDLLKYVEYIDFKEDLCVDDCCICYCPYNSESKIAKLSVITVSILVVLKNGLKNLEHVLYVEVTYSNVTIAMGME